MSNAVPRAIGLVVALAAVRVVPASVAGRDADAWFRDAATQAEPLARELMEFEARDDATLNRSAAKGDRFAGEWALVTHQMTALGLAQVALAKPDRRAELAPFVTKAALKSFRPEMRDFGTRAWSGEDALASVASTHGHAYLAYAALAIGMARLLDPAFPREHARHHDALIAAYERRLLASPTGLIETYPNEAYPTDVAAVAAAIAVHGRATRADHTAVLRHWAERVRAAQIDPSSGLFIQRMSATTGARHDVPRGSGTGLGAYFAGFADRGVAELLTDGLLRQEATFLGFGAIREYAPGTTGSGDVDSGPVVLGVSVSATGFALAPARAFGHRDSFEKLFRTTELFGMWTATGERAHFATGGPIGDALLFALLTSGPELAP